MCVCVCLQLIQGLYIFQVTVTAPGKYGEAFVNVTVLPRKLHTAPVSLKTA